MGRNAHCEKRREEATIDGKGVRGGILLTVLWILVIIGTAGLDDSRLGNLRSEYYVEVPESGQSSNKVWEEWDAATELNVPGYWTQALAAGADGIRLAVETAGMDKSAFLFYSDAHRNNSAQVSPALLDYLYRYTPLNKVIFGGDIVNNEPDAETLSDRSIMEYLWQWRAQIRELRHYSVVGNHDDGNTTNNILSSDYVYAYLFAPEEGNEIVRGGNTYYYFDEVSEKTRYLCLDTAYLGFASNEAQQKFVAESLKSTPDGWHIVVVAHIWYEPDYDRYSETPIPVTGLSKDAEALAAVLDSYNARTGEFADCGAWVEFGIGGHVHRDYVGQTGGGIPIILCETDSRTVRSGLECKRGTTSEASVSGIIADYRQGKITVVRIGRGSSFEVPLRSGAG